MTSSREGWPSIACSDERRTAGGFVLRYASASEGADVFIVLVYARVGGGSPTRRPPIRASRLAHARGDPLRAGDQGHVRPGRGGHPDCEAARAPRAVARGRPPSEEGLRDPNEVSQGRRTGRYEFLKVEGEGVSEIPGRPGPRGNNRAWPLQVQHPRRDSIVNLETRLYYTHRGVEKLAES